VCWRIEAYARRTLESLRGNASEDFRLVVVDNRSVHSAAIAAWAAAEVARGGIDLFLGLEDNIYGNALRTGYELSPPDASEDFFVFTDLDLVVPDGLDWIAETRRMQSDPGLAVSGFSLSLENYLPPNSGHESDPYGHAMGVWLMGIKRALYDAHFPDDTPLVDHLLLNTLGRHGRIERSRREVYHLGWDIPRDDPEYWQLKLAGVPWRTNTRCAVDVRLETQRV
jgi:glycosyltransferase involved in cell wall biosynthesis